MLVQENAKSPAIFGAITDSEGRFQIKGVPPGRYRFSARRVGFVGQQYQAKGASQGAILSLTPRQEVNDAVFRLTRAAVISGRVVDKAGEPMVHVYVSTLRRTTPEEQEEYEEYWSKPLAKQGGSLENCDYEASRPQRYTPRNAVSSSIL